MEFIALTQGARKAFEAISDDGTKLGSVVLRIHSGKPSYYPETLTEEEGVQFEATKWGDDPRTFSWVSANAKQVASVSLSVKKNPDLTIAYSVVTDDGQRLTLMDLPDHQQDSIKQLLKSGWPEHEKTGKEHLHYYLHKMKNRINKRVKQERIDKIATYHEFGDWTVKVSECHWDEKLKDIFIIYDDPDDNRDAVITRYTAAIDATSDIGQQVINEAIQEARHLCNCPASTVRTLLMAGQEQMLDEELGSMANKAKKLAREANNAAASRRWDDEKKANRQLRELMQENNMFGPPSEPDNS